MALAIGILDVAAVLRLPAKKFRDWEIYAELEPFGELRADYRAALIAQTVFNMAVDKKNRLPLKNFVLPTGDDEAAEQKPQTPDQQLALVKLLSAMHAAEPEPEAVVQTSLPDPDKERNERFKAEVARARAAMNPIS